MKKLYKESDDRVNLHETLEHDEHMNGVNLQDLLLQVLLQGFCRFLRP